MRKIRLSLLLVIIMTVFSAGVVFAARSEYVEGKRVYDYADLFTDAEEQSLEEYALSVEDEARSQFYVLTIDDAEGKSAMEYADDFGDNGAFGYEEEYGTYVVMLIDMDNREVLISTSGNAIQYLNDYRIDKTLDEVFEYMPDGEYYRAAKAYLECAYGYMLSDPSEDRDKYYDNDYSDTIYYDDGHYYEEEPDVAGIVILCLVVSAVISGIVLIIMITGAKTKMSVGSSTYMSGSGLKINQREDVFTHTTTVKRKIETSSGSSGGSRSGGSSVHRSSGGHSHGGGGRKF